MKKELVSVVFPTMNRKTMLIDCIQSMLGQDYGKENIEIIIADNGSTDGSVEAIQKKFPSVKIIQNEFNLGSPLAINQCILKSKGEIIFRLDDDTIIEKDCVSKMVKVLKSDEKVGAVACTMLYGKDYDPKEWNLIRNMGLSVNLWTSKVSVRNHDILDEGQFTEIEEIDAAGGGMLMFKRKVCKEIGLFDERMFLAFEDAHWCYKLRNKGYKILQIPSAKLHHRQISENQKKKDKMKRFKPFYFLHTVRSKLIFMRDLAGFRNLFFIPFHLIFVVPIMSLKYLTQGDIELIKNYLKGTWMGLFDNRIIAYIKQEKMFDYKKSSENLGEPKNIKW